MRVCKKCYENRENVNKIKNILNDSNSIPNPDQNENDLDVDDEDDDDPDINFEVRAEKLNSADQSTDDIYSNIYDQAHQPPSSSTSNHQASNEPKGTKWFITS